MRRDDCESVDRRGKIAGDCGCSGLRRCESCGLGIARYGDAWNTGQMLGQPLDTLRERLRVRVDPRDLGKISGVRQKILLDAKLHFAANRKLRLAHEIERTADGSFGRVLNGHDSVVGLPALGGAKDFVDRRVGVRIDELTEVTRDRCVTECSGRAQVRDTQALLEREARRHDLPEHARDRVVGERPAVLDREPRQDLRFALGPIRGSARLESADRVRMGRTRVQLLENFAIERIDRFTMTRELGVAIVVARH